MISTHVERTDLERSGPSPVASPAAVPSFAAFPTGKRSPDHWPNVAHANFTSFRSLTTWGRSVPCSGSLRELTPVDDRAGRKFDSSGLHRSPAVGVTPPPFPSRSDGGPGLFFGWPRWATRSPSQLGVDGVDLGVRFADRPPFTLRIARFGGRCDRGRSHPPACGVHTPTAAAPQSPRRQWGGAE